MIPATATVRSAATPAGSPSGYVAGAQWAVLLGVLAALLAVCNRGFDPTDEAYYVFWMLDPGRFAASIHPFGLLLHPLFVATGRSVVALRVLATLAVAGGGIVLGAYVGRYYRVVERHALAFDARALTGLFALGGHVAISVLTPGYNMLANVAGCLILAGVLGWAACDAQPQAARRADILPALLVGFGGALAALAKPTFAVLALVAVAVPLVACWRRRAATARRRMVVVAVACLAPLAAAVTGTMPLGQLLAAFREGQATLTFGNGLASLPYKTLHDLVFMQPPLLLTIMACAGLWKAQTTPGSTPRRRRLAALGVLLLAVVYWLESLGLALAEGTSRGGVLGPQALGVALALITVVRVTSRDGALRARAWWPVAWLLGLPLAIAFGTANPLMSQTSASLFAMLLALAITGDLALPRRAAIGLQATLAAFTLGLLAWSAAAPTGLAAPVWAQVTPLRFGPTGETLRVDRATADYALALQRIASANGLTPETPIIDLSGGGPGTALLLGGRAPYFPWIIQLYSNVSHRNVSLRLADTAWASLTPAEQRRAWLILPANPVFANSEALRVARRRGGYRLAGRVPAAFWRDPRWLEVWVPARPA